VPKALNVAKTSSLSISPRVASSVFGALEAPSKTISVGFRLSIPPSALSFLK